MSAQYLAALPFFPGFYESSLEEDLSELAQHVWDKKEPK